MIGKIMKFGQIPFPSNVIFRKKTGLGNFRKIEKQYAQPVYQAGNGKEWVDSHITPCYFSLDTEVVIVDNANFQPLDITKKEVQDDQQADWDLWRGAVQRGT